MGYSELDKRTREVAESVLTQKQLDVFRLWMNGASTSRIGMMLDIAEPVARRTRDRAVQKVSIELAKPTSKEAA
jgi:DNA-binding CsgD family transcriptional regulator